METSDILYDYVVIGGGISGLGVVWEAAQQGKKALLVEKSELCRATSDNSLRIIHGGLRYLQQLNIKRVLESAKEQHDLLKIAPEYVKPLWCVMPLNKFGLKSKFPMTVALYFFAFLRACVGTGFENCGRVVSSAWVDEHVPFIKGLAPHGAFIWRDAVMPSDRKFVNFVRDEAEKSGAKILTSTLCTGFEKKGDIYQVTLQNANEKYQVSSKFLINTTGAWLQRIEQKSLFKPLKWCKAVNLVVSRQLLNAEAVGVTGDLGRVFFFAPRIQNEFDVVGTAIGTFYYMYDGDPDTAKVSEVEIEQALKLVNKALPNLNAKREEIVRVEMGILPASGENARGPVLYGSEQIKVSEHYVEVLSTKFTTFRNQARHVLKLCQN